MDLQEPHRLVHLGQIRIVRMTGRSHQFHTRRLILPEKSRRHPRVVQQTEDVPVDHEERILQPRLEPLHSSGRASDLRLELVIDSHSPARAVLKMAANDVGPIVEVDEDLVDAVAAQPLHVVLQERATRHRDHGLGDGVGEGSQAIPEPGRQDDRLADRPGGIHPCLSRRLTNRAASLRSRTP